MSTHGKFREVEFDRIVVGEEFENYREMYSDEDIDDQADSFKEVGLLQNLVVRERRVANKHVYDLVAGFKRFFAMQKLRKRDKKRFFKVPVKIVKTKDMSTLLLIGITENLKRKEHTNAELAVALGRLENLGMSRSAIAKKLGRQPSWVSDILNTDEAAEPELKQANAKKQLSNAKYRKSSKLNKGNQKKVARKARTLSKDKNKGKRIKSRELDDTIKEAQRDEGKDTSFKPYRRKDECSIMAGEMFEEITGGWEPDQNDEDQNKSREFGYKEGFLAAMAWFLGADAPADMDSYDVRDHLEGKGLTGLRPEPTNFDGEPSDDDLADIEDELAAVGADFEDDE